MGLGNVEGWYTITIDNEWNDGYDYYGDKETLEICPECFPLVQSAMVAAGVKI